MTLGMEAVRSAWSLVLSGERFIPAEIFAAQPLRPSANANGLTAREQEVADLLTDLRPENSSKFG